MQRMIVIGDVHGCLEELDELLRALEYRRGGPDRLVMAGDLVDRGPDPAGCVRRVREIGAECVLGNHEEKALRWLRNEERRRATGKANLMQRPPDSRLAEWESLSPDDVAWLRKLPLTIKHGKWTVVHAGFEPGRPMDQQRPDKVMRVRWVDEKGIMKPSDDLLQPPDSVCWMEQWRGPGGVFYGHAVHSLNEPRVDGIGELRCIGVDTGCVFGGLLTAALVDGGSVEFVSVPARREYLPLHRRRDGAEVTSP